MIAEEKFKLSQVTKDGRSFVFLSGFIDEDSKFEELVKLSSPLVINFKDVSGINSCGVRNWVNLLKEISDKEVSYEECVPLIVRQLNMIPSFKGHATVKSVYAPYVCDNCEKELSKIISDSDFDSEKLEAVIKCTACGKEEMELDGDPDQYFAFTQ